MRESTLALNSDETRSGLFVVESTRGRKRAHLNSIPGRSRKRAILVSSLYKDLREKFEKLRAAGIKFSCTLLQDLAEDLIAKAVTESPYYLTLTHSSRPILSHVTPR